MVHQDNLGLLDRKVVPALQGPRVCKAHLVRMVSQVLLVLQDQRELQGVKGHRVQRDPLEHLVE